jgi:hypothetical protein
MIAIGDLPHNLNLLDATCHATLVILPVANGIPHLAVLIRSPAARNNTVGELTNFSQPVSRPCVFRSENGESNWNNDERRARQNQERDSDQQHRRSNNRDDDSPDDLDILNIPKTQNPFDPIHVA